MCNLAQQMHDWIHQVHDIVCTQQSRVKTCVTLCLEYVVQAALVAHTPRHLHACMTHAVLQTCKHIYRCTCPASICILIYMHALHKPTAQHLAGLLSRAAFCWMFVMHLLAPGPQGSSARIGSTPCQDFMGVLVFAMMHGTDNTIKTLFIAACCAKLGTTKAALIHCSAPQGSF